MKIIVNDKSLTVEEKETLVSKNVNTYEMQVEYDDSYKNCGSCHVVFSNDNINKKTLVGPDKKVIIPHEVLENKGTLAVGFFGTYIENDVLKERHVTNIDVLPIICGGYNEDAEETEELTPTILEKYLQEMKSFYDESLKEYNDNATEKIKDFNTDYETKKSEIDEVSKKVSEDKEAVSEIKSSVEASEQNAKTSEDNAKASETSAQNSANKASKSETNVANIEKNINAIKEQIDTIKTNIDGQVNTVNTLAENAATQATKSENQAEISTENAAATSADKNAVSEMKSEVEEFKIEAKTSRDETESLKNETLQAKEVVENSLEKERIESEKRYAKSVDTEVITVEEFAQVELDEDGYMEDVVVEASKEITQETHDSTANILYTQEKYWEVGGISAQGGSLTENVARLRTKELMPIEELTNYYCSLENSKYAFVNIHYYDSNGTWLTTQQSISDNIQGYQHQTITTPESIKYFKLLFKKADETEMTLSDLSIAKPMVVKGTTKIDFIEGYPVMPSLNYPSEFQNMLKEVSIQNNGFTNTLSLPEGQFLGNFKGYSNAIDKGVLKGQLKELILTGDESWTLFQTSTNTARFVLAKAPHIMVNSETEIMYLCNYFKAYLPSERVEDKEGLFVANSWYNEINQNEIYIRANINEISTLESFKAKLKELYNAGTPVKILYVALEEQQQELSQENLQVVNSLQTYQGENNISTPEAKLSFKANQGISSFVNKVVDEKLVENNLAEREISDSKYARALKKEVFETDFVQIYAENEGVEGLKIYGAELTQETRQGYNELKNEATNQTIDGIDFVVKEDGTVIANGTALVDVVLILNSKTSLENGNYYISGCPAGGSGTTYAIRVWDNSWALLAQDDGNSDSFTLQEHTDGIRIGILIKQGTTVNNLVFKPMIVKEKQGLSYEQHGDMPSLGYPSEVQVTNKQEIQVANENLISDTDNLYKTVNGGNIQISVNEKGIIILNGTPTTNYVSLTSGKNITDFLKDGETYTLYKTNSSEVYNQITASKRDGSGNEYYANFNDKKVFTVDKSKYKSYNYNIQLGAIANSVTFDNYECNFMLLHGDYTNKEVTYIPHEGSSSQIVLPQDTFNGSIGDYKDTIKEVDGRWKIVKRIGEFVLNGTETFYEKIGNDTTAYNTTVPKPCVDTIGFSNYFKLVTSNSNTAFNILYQGLWLKVPNGSFENVEGLKNWLATKYAEGNPVKFKLVLITPEYIDLPDETQEILNGIKLRLGLNNFSIDVGTFSYIYNKSLAKELEEKDALIEELTSKILALENVTLNLAEGE